MALKTVQCPLLFIHSPGDEIIPIQLGENLFEAAPEPKTFVQIDGDHNSGFIVSLEKYENSLRTFLDSIKTSSPVVRKK